MNSTATSKLHLEDLANKAKAITPDAVGFYKENCMVCFHSQGHSSGIHLFVEYKDDRRKFEILWSGSVTEQMLRAYVDNNKTTDFGACVIALLLLPELTEFSAYEQSSVGTTIDYYLVAKEVYDDTLIFNYSARLEVSGIRAESPTNTVDSRIKQKIGRLMSDGEMPTLISVIEFSKPWSKMVDA